MDLTAIIKAIGLAGSTLPAFKALLDQVKILFNEADQAMIDRTYAQAMAASDAAHRDAQSL